MKKNIKAFIFMLFAMFSLLSTTVPTAVAGFSFNMCTGMGSGFTSVTRSEPDLFPDKQTRKWTAEELYGNSLQFSNYTGEGEGSILIADVEKKASNGISDDAVKRIESKRNFLNCATGGIGSTLATIPLAIGAMLVSFTKMFVVSLFDPNFVCSDGNTANCINLLSLIGGGNGFKDGGIIGILSDGIYWPLILLAVLFAAIYILYIGIIQRKIREGFVSVIWVLFAFFTGVILLTMPDTIAKGPQKITQAISGCIMGGLNGDNCLTGEKTQDYTDSFIPLECKSDITNAPSGSDSAIYANGMSCMLWKTFVLENWAKGQFGTSYSNLYTSDPPKSGKIIDNFKGTGDYCVNFNGTLSTTDNVDSLNGDKVCNIALKHLEVKSLTKSDENDRDKWNSIVQATAEDPQMWSAWSPNSNFIRFASGLAGMITSIFAVGGILVFSFMGILYSITGTLLIAFAPLFLLFAIHPDKGRKMFLGWVESIISAILKYMASTLFVVIGLVLYAGVLSTTSGVSAFVGSLVISGTLWMYRKEFINMIGATSMGGIAVKNKLGEKLTDKKDKILDKSERMTKETIGAGIGSVAAGGTFTEGAKSGVLRDLKRGRGVVSSAVRQYDRTSSQNKRLNKNKDNNTDEEENNNTDNNNSNDNNTGNNNHSNNNTDNNNTENNNNHNNENQHYEAERVNLEHKKIDSLKAELDENSINKLHNSLSNILAKRLNDDNYDKGHLHNANITHNKIQNDLAQYENNSKKIEQLDINITNNEKEINKLDNEQDKDKINRLINKINEANEEIRKMDIENVVIAEDIVENKQIFKEQSQKAYLYEREYIEDNSEQQ